MKVSSFFLHLTLFWITLTTKIVSTAPKNPIKTKKSLSYFDFLQKPEETDFLSSTFQRLHENKDQNDANNIKNDVFSLTRSYGVKKSKPASNQVFNSPIYYIRLPPQPFMFIPGFGYVSKPELNVPESFLNVPVDFISNGKPGMIYQWNGGFVDFPAKENEVKKIKKTKIKSKSDSRVYKIPGKFVFNGKPNDVFVLTDKYGFYNDGLQSFYP
ncbi:uncharacterized protein [Onthophagus taurus]|uniref:uncharacterized protein n=1 Tax=Onthophagus taurus TaxID=166361 RepID=UPI000C2076EE|nr:uncharacterized protein LOC111422226 [Onthophagus taurus]